LHNEELRDFYTLPNIIMEIKSRRVRWAGHVARMEDIRKSCNISDGTPAVKRPLRISRRRPEDNIKIDLRERV